MSRKYTLNKEDLYDILGVVAWSGASAVVATLLTIIPELELPTQYMFVVPIVNSVLYSLHKFLQGRVS